MLLLLYPQKPVLHPAKWNAVW